MKFKEVTLKRNFAVNFMTHEHIHLGTVIELNEGECPIEGLVSGHDMIKEALLRICPEMPQQFSTVAGNQPIPIVDVLKTPVEGMIEAITGCSSVEVLKTFEKLAKSKPDFQKAYDETFKKLTDGL